MHSLQIFRASRCAERRITDEEIILKNVSEEFIAAWNGRPAAPRVEQAAEAKQIVKVRCPDCRALNEEDAKFCKQCGRGL